MPLLGALVYKTLDLVFEKGDINYDLLCTCRKYICLDDADFHNK